MKKQIYPIYLPTYLAKALISKHVADEFEKAKRSHYHSNSRFDYSAKLLADGNVEIHVHYNFDDGFCMGAGGLFDATIRPFNDEQLLAYKRNRILELAEVEYDARQAEERLKKVVAVAREMFGDEFA